MVFLVDDDIDDVMLVQEAFERNDFKEEITSAYNGEQFFSLLKKPHSKPPKLIVLDLNMPLKNGFEVLKDLKASPLYASIPVAVLTASSNKQDEIRCRELGCNLFFRKPSSVREYDSLVLLMLSFLKGANY